MSWLSKLFGKGEAGAAASAPSEEYKGFTITPAPKAEGGHYRIGALIEKGERSHDLIRADVVESHDVAVEASLNKAKQMIDEQGERLFDGW